MCGCAVWVGGKKNTYTTYNPLLFVCYRVLPGRGSGNKRVSLRVQFFVSQLLAFTFSSYDL
jgi:hypothetical protein